MRATERMHTNTSPPSPGDPERVARLQPVIESLIEAHERLVALLEAHRGAIARADSGELARVADEERAVLESIGALESSCRALLDGSGAKTVSALAQRAGGEGGGRLGESAAYLRALATRAHAMQAAVREAGEAMALHIGGLMRQVAARLSHAGTYGAGGRVESTAPVVTGLDLKQ